LIFLCLGFGWFLSSLGVYIRDIGQGITVILQILFFISPIFYPTESVPERFQKILLVNPLTFIVTNFRQVLLWNMPLQWDSWAVETLISFIFALLGYAWFIKTKKGFADVL
jgi:homopolymeric O-antigen transport system permease protein